MENESVTHFIASAEAFCSLIEQRQPLTVDAFVFQCAMCLAELYRSAVLLSLPSLESDGGGAIETAVSTEQTLSLIRDIGHAFGEVRWYWEVFDPREKDMPVVGDLADDLADIYSDVKNGLVAFRRGAMHAAIRHLQESFRYHWGDHVVDALRALHRLISTELIDRSLANSSSS
jgi:hypothetical protein